MRPCRRRAPAGGDRQLGVTDTNLARFRAAVAGALAHLESRREEVNDLNVFPVADGDTGDNMALTLRAVLDELDRIQASDEGRTIDEIGREEIVQSVFGSFFRRARSGDYDVPVGDELWKLFLVIALLMIPGILTLVPQFILIKSLGLFNTPWALIIPYISGGQVFAIFILRQFFAAIPEELFEAARIDGASEARAFLMLSVPLSQSILGVVTIMHVLHSWNDLIWPLVTLTSQSNFTLTLGLFAFRNENWTNWGPLFAGYVIGAVPLMALFAFTSKLFVRGLTSGAIKA